MLIKIYKIVNNITNEVYIGSTTQPLYRRWNDHKQRSKRLTGPYCSSKILFDKYGANNCSIVLEHEQDVINREHANKLEREYIDRYSDVCVNKNLPFKTPDEIAKLNVIYAHKYDATKYVNSNIKQKRMFSICCIKCKKELKLGSITRHLKKSCEKLVN